MSNKQEKSFFIQHLYLSQINFNVHTAAANISDQWEPESSFSLDIQGKTTEENKHLVELKLSIEVKIKDQKIFNIQLTQAGIFSIQGYSDEDIDKLQKVFCPNILFPYARQIVTQMTTQAGYPPLNLSPVDFESRYQQLKQESEAQQ